MDRRGEPELPEKKSKKPYPSLRKLSRKEDAWHSEREKKKNRR
jgi:hypothetical protein